MCHCCLCWAPCRVSCFFFWRQQGQRYFISKWVKFRGINWRQRELSGLQLSMAEVEKLPGLKRSSYFLCLQEWKMRAEFGARIWHFFHVFLVETMPGFVAKRKKGRNLEWKKSKDVKFLVFGRKTAKLFAATKFDKILKIGLLRPDNVSLRLLANKAFLYPLENVEYTIHKTCYFKKNNLRENPKKFVTIFHQHKIYTSLSKKVFFQFLKS